MNVRPLDAYQVAGTSPGDAAEFVTTSVATFSTTGRVVYIGLKLDESRDIPGLRKGSGIPPAHNVFLRRSVTQDMV